MRWWVRKGEPPRTKEEFDPWMVVFFTALIFLGIAGEDLVAWICGTGVVGF